MNKQEEKLKKLDTARHSLAHVLAKAVTELYDGAKLTIGPTVEGGFYYDFDLGESKIEKCDFKAIEKQMQKILNSNQNMTLLSIIQTIHTMEKGIQKTKSTLSEDRLKNQRTRSIPMYHFTLLTRIKYISGIKMTIKNINTEIIQITQKTFYNA